MKTIPKLSYKSWKYLVLFGIFLGIAGLVSGFISNVWSLATVGLLVAGMVFVILGIGLAGTQPQGFLRQRFAQEGINAIVATLSVLAILGLLNFLAVRYSTRLDLTENRIFTLSPQSKQIVANLPKPLKVLVFDPKPDPLDRELLDNYRRQGPNFRVEFIDPQVQLGLAEKFKLESLKEVHLEYGDRQQRVQAFRDETELLNEVQLTNGIERILRDRQPIVYFLQGHGELSLENSQGEGSLSQAVSELAEKGYQVEPLNLGQQPGIPEDADAIAIIGPKRSLFEGEVEALKDYLDRGGSLLLAIDPKTDPGLDPILEEWGIELDSRLVIDASGGGSILGFGPATPLVTNYGVHPITADFGNGNSVYPLARSLEAETIENIQAFPLLITNEQSWAESDLESEDLAFDPDDDLGGPLTLGFALSDRNIDSIDGDEEGSQEESEQDPNDDASDESEASSEEDDDSQEDSEQTLDNDASDEEESEQTSDADADASDESETSSEDKEDSEQTPDDDTNDESEASNDEDDETTKEARLVVFGNSTFASNGWFEEQLNGDVFVNSIKWLAKADDSTLSVRPNAPKERRLNLTLTQAGIIGWLAVFIVPVLGLAIAGLMWWLRR